MRYKELIRENYKNILSKDMKNRQQYATEVWEILQQSYQNIGGIKGNGFNNIEDMIENIPFWKICVRGGEVTAVMMYKDNRGRKMVAVGVDGYAIGKKDLANMISDEHKTKRSYAEISGALLGFYRKVLGDEFDGIRLPSEKAVEIFGADNIKLVDEYHYKRSIGGKWIDKIMIGNIDAKFPDSSSILNK